MESKKISELEQYNGSANGFMVPGVADGETQKADLGAMVDQAAGAAGYLKPSGLKTINGESIAGSGDLDVDMKNPFKGWYATLAALQSAVGSPKVGDFAYIKGATASDPAAIYECTTAGTWSDSGRTVDTSNVQTFETGQAVNGTGIKDLDGNNDPNAAGVLSAEAGLQVGAKLLGVTAEKVLFAAGYGSVTTGKKISNTGVISDSANESIIAVPVGGYDRVSFFGYIATAAHTYGYAVYSSAEVFSNDTLLVSFGYDDNHQSGEPYYRMYEVSLPPDAVTLVCMYEKNNFPVVKTRFNGILYRGKTVVDAIDAVKVKSEGITLTESPYNNGNYNIFADTRIDGAGAFVSSTSHISSAELDVSGYNAVRFLGVALRSALFLNDTRVRYAFGHYVEGVWRVDLVCEYDINSANANSVKEYIAAVPSSSTHLRLIVAYPDLYSYEDFYCYMRRGLSTTETIKQVCRMGETVVLSLLDVPVYGNDGGNSIAGYMNTSGKIFDNTNHRVFYLKVKKGERYLFVVEPTENWESIYNIAVFGYNSEIPTVGVTLDDVVSGVVVATQSAEGSEHQPATLRMQWEAQNNGYLCYYYVNRQASVNIYKVSVEQSAEPALYDTYVEVDLDRVEKPTNLTGATLCEKRYSVEPGMEYRLIYRHIANQQFNSWSQYDAAGLLLVSSSDSGQDGYSEHIMESITMHSRAKVFVVRFWGESSLKVGTIDKGMAALMKPLRDDGAMPVNSIVYFVSRVKVAPMSDEINDNVPGTANVEDIWSAWGVKFPEGHKLSGKPTALVGHFHGTGGVVTSECLSYVYRYGTYMHELLNGAGLAVFDVNGRGVSFAEDRLETSNGVQRGDRQRHWGNPAAVATAKKAYEVLTGRFNCRKGMVIGCTSMGGCLVESYANTYPQDLVAAYMCAPAVLGTNCRTQNYRDGIDVGRAWGATGAHAGDISLVLGYSNWVKLVVKEQVQIDESTTISYFTEGPTNLTLTDILNNTNGIREKIYAPFPVELVVWQGTADTNVSPIYPETFVAAARRAGSNVKIRLCSGYEHPLMDFYPEVVEYVKSKLVI